MSKCLNFTGQRADRPTGKRPVPLDFKAKRKVPHE